VSSPALAFPVKSPDAFRTISEVAAELDLPQHVLRFWESRFSQIKPVKRAGARRYYRPQDIDLLRGIRTLLHNDGLTIRGVQKVLKEKGLRHVTAIGQGLPPDVTPLVVEKLVYVEKPAPVPPPKKRGSHLRAVPSPAPMSLPLFDNEIPAPAAIPATPVLVPMPSVAQPSLPVQTVQDGLAGEERRRLEALLAELSGLKTRLAACKKAAI
jgi:DNA-binding transcriptional MerR regulator